MKRKLSRILTVGLAAVISLAAVPVNAQSSGTEINMEKVGGYSSGMSDADGGVMEIIAYNSSSQYAYAVNGKSGKLAVIPLNGEGTLTASEFDVKAAVNDESFVYGDMTSVDVSPNGELLAAAVQAEGYADSGKAVIFKCNADGSLEFLKAVDTGVQPDMVVFADNSTILTADEGEPREGYGEGTADPKGSVTVINLDKDTSTVVDFTSFDEKRDELTDKNVVLKKNTLPSADLEPEYIAVSGGTAYVTLQEANAVAVMDIESKNFTGIYSVGFEDYSGIKVDIDKKDEKYDPKTYESLMGIRMPDGIAAFSCGGKAYIVTANEGDSREWGDYLNEDERNFGKGKTSPTGKITPENSGLAGKVVFFDAGDYDGLDAEKDYLFGGRSFTVFEAGEDGIKEVYDSADDFERITAEKLPEYFNCSNDDITIDDRSGKKGPEPESVITGTVDGRTYAFIALERIGGIMAYDITDPEKISYAGYINSREFTDDIAGDVAPEGLEFVPASKNPYGRNLLLAACEVSGTAAVYALGKVPEKVTAGGGSSVSRYTVRFDTDGAGSIPNQTVKKNGKAEEPAVPVKEGYIFTGWYTDKELTEKYDFNSDVVKGMTLYAGWEKKPDPETGRIVLTIGEKSAEVFGKTEYSDTAPFIRNDRTMTPARFVAEALGARVQWNEAERTVTVTKDGIEIVLTINSDTAIVNGNNVRLDSPAVIENNRTYTPARFIGETLGAKVEWDAETRRVIITK